MTDHGYVARDYRAEPVGASIPVYSGLSFPRSDWPELIELQKKRKASPLAVHEFNRVPVLNQARLKYCWCFALVSGIMNRYAFSGINDPTPHLSATAPAAQGKRYRNRGGYLSEAVRFIGDYGLPTVDLWPEDSMDRALAVKPKVIASAARHKLVAFEDLGANDLDLAISAMLDPAGACPVAFSLPWWRHAICGLKIEYRGSDPNRLESYGLTFANSYGRKWGADGRGTIWGDKLRGQEFIVIRQVRPRNE
jgi:hypothetical protein